MSVAYLDSSALVKLVVPERESVALKADLRGCRMVSSVVSRIEVVRAALRRDEGLADRAGVLLQATDLIPLNVAIETAASVLSPRSMRSLDAVQLATMLSVHDEVPVVYCYEQRLAEAAREHGIEVRSPGLAA